MATQQNNKLFYKYMYIYVIVVVYTDTHIRTNIRNKNTFTN